MALDNLPSVTMLYFASLRTSLPTSPDSQTIILPASPCSLLDFRKHLLDIIHPSNDEFRAALAKSLWSVNEEMVEREEEGTTLLIGGETVCGIPPVSGG
ncbi:hypothetical protein T439DRAFT_356756 [Meredithblackwellia eburnea MCA 4105]